MPLYDYQCKKCKHRFEKIQKFSDAPVRKCPECGGPVEKLLTAPAVHFKGSGWYVSDYARKSGEGKSPSSSEGSTDESSAAKAVEKVESKSGGADSGSQPGGDASTAANEKKAKTETKGESKKKQ